MPGLVAGVLLAACSSTDPATTTARPEPTVTTTTVPGTTTTHGPTSTTGTATTSSSANPPRAPAIDPEIGIPDGGGPFPAVVLVHGGGWVSGDPSLVRSLASKLTDEGFLTVNTDYTLADGQPGFPGAVDDIACAVRLAQSHPEADGTVAVLGHSAGAHLAAIVALTGDDYGTGCEYPGSGLPDRLVGLAGPYDVTRLGILMVPFFGGGPQVEEAAWFAGNPHNLVAENTRLATLLLHGDEDGIVETSFSFNFGSALADAGSEVLVEVVEGAGHMEVRDPDVVGDLIVTWLLR